MNKTTPPPKVAVFYHYYELDSVYRDNLIFFLATGYLQDVDFYIIISGACSVDLPQKPNITYLYAENKNYDYGGYCHALSQVKDVEKYDFCIFVNSSMRGPFLVSYFQGDWTEVFTQWLQGDVHLVGASVNLMMNKESYFDFLQTDHGYPKPHAHVQSTAYALSRVALRHLLKIGFYDDKEEMSKEDVIALYELVLSQEIKKQGWNMKCLCAPYNTIDYRKPHGDINPSSLNGYMLLKNGFFGRTVSPLENVFMKSKADAIANKDFKVLLVSHTYTTMMTDIHADMADWSQVQDLFRRTKAAIEKFSLTVVPKKHPLRIFGKFYNSVKKRIKRLFGVK